MSKIRIFLTDDHRIVRNGITTLLQQVPDFEVVGEADNGPEALEKIPSLKPDIALMDVSMPDMNGFQVAEHIREMGLTTQILFLSMHEEPEYFIRAMKSGGGGYVLKDANKDELELAIRRVAAGERYFGAQIVAMMADSGDGNQPSRAEQMKPKIELSAREMEVLQEVADGLITKEIADKLHISPRTVETHRLNIMKKLKANNTAELIKLAVLYRLVDV
jgi:DNA-binding NarL/FixJ family response regulator